MKRIFISILTFLFCICHSAQAQVVWSEQFNRLSDLNNWQLSSKVEYGRQLGYMQSNYVRFHPRFQNEFLRTPTIGISDGRYVLTFYYNMARNFTYDSVQLDYTTDNGTNWVAAKTLIGGNHRNWQKDSVSLQLFGSGVSFRWRYYSQGVFPSQFFNLDEIELRKTLLTNVSNKSSLDIDVFPNPAHQFLFFKASASFEKPITITIYDMSGKIIVERIWHNADRDYSIDVSGLSAATYLVSFKNELTDFCKTIIIQP